LAEFGCFKGFSSSCLSYACGLVGVRLHVFDSFAGLPESESTYYKAGDYKADFSEVRQNILEFGNARCTQFHAGFFADTVPKAQTGPLACVFLDVDLAASAADALGVFPNLHRRGAVFSHEIEPTHFDDRGRISVRRTPDHVLPPIEAAFLSRGRSPRGQHLSGAIGVVADEAAIPPPTAALAQLYRSAMDW
jgi:hypothetical protein